MLYPKNSTKSLDRELFKNPTSEYRGTPFWAWNCKLENDMLGRQIDIFKQMGLGGFHMHSRTGMDTPYLGDEFMESVRFCVEKARSNEMLAWLYDEDRWPSGFAGGLLTKDPKYRKKLIMLTSNDFTDDVSPEEGYITGKKFFVAAYDVVLGDGGELVGYTRIARDAEAKGNKWYAFVKTSDTSNWHNNQAYGDTMDKESMRRFVEITYDAYKKAVGGDFGGIVPAIFTDEPQMQSKRFPDFAKDTDIDIILPWSTTFEADFAARYGFGLLDRLPEVIWMPADGKPSKMKYCFSDFISEQFTSAFADICGTWCGENGIALTGHLMEEPTLRSQSNALGEAMRSYRAFQLPGIDMLCDRVELTTAKQAQSASHQYGREGVLSEMYGVTDWDFDFRGHKFQGDWQAAMGITVRVPHLSLVSMHGEAKRDYPASISYQSPWCGEYSYVENHFARVATALTRGKPVVKIGMIHPIESYWLELGPNDTTSLKLSGMDENFQNITQWLLFNQLDFDFISESLLPSQCAEGCAPLKVGAMEYSAVVVPGCTTLRKTTLDRLKAFREAGGRLIFVSECPKYLDAEASDEPRRLWEDSIKADFNSVSVVSALSQDRLVDILCLNGSRASGLIYNMREDNDCRWLFIAHAVKEKAIDTVRKTDIIIKLKGEFDPEIYNTLNGEILPADYEVKDGFTLVYYPLYSFDTLLLRLGNAKGDASHRMKAAQHTEVASIDFKRKLDYTLSERNVLLLDMAEYALDGGEYRPLEEILRADNICRREVGLPGSDEKIPQPWTVPKEPATHVIKLRFAIDSEVAVKAPLLAVEDAEKVAITFNGKKVPSDVVGYYVDESIKTVKLPDIVPGENTLVLEIPLGRNTYTEWCYLLGDFGVRVEGIFKTVTAAPAKLAFGDITRQGFPFYTGNVIYKADFDMAEPGNVSLTASTYRGALVGAELDGRDIGRIVYPPYNITVENVAAGRHTLEITLFGNRHNGFSPLHHANRLMSWVGPGAWRSTGAEWSYEYLLRELGILKSPVIEIYR